LPAVIRAFDALAAEARGEMRAAVTSAVPLDAAQKKALATRLKTELGREVTIDLDVDPAILGGLVVRIGSRMIDSSIATKLNSLAYAMKG
jgi:F-type H+-transporting ATPase subunit delta